MKINPRLILVTLLVMNIHPARGGTAPATLVINEIHYDEDIKTRRSEFIEIHNATPDAVDLTDWKLTGGVDYAFPEDTNIASGAYLVIAEDPATIRSQFSFHGAFGPWSGKLRNSGETVNLRDQHGTVISRADYRLGFPWPTVGDAVGSPAVSPSIQLIHPLLETELGGSWRSAPPTAGRRNAPYNIEAPPQVRQVSHTPKQPASDVPVVISARVTDPEGVSSVSLAYQTIRPGGYFCRYLKFSSNGSPNFDPRYELPTAWNPVPMADDGLNDDLLAGDGIFTVTLPGTVQRNRYLIRYRITVTDASGNSVRVPYEDDPQPNFAFFVYDGTPDWAGSIRAGDPPVNFSGELMSSIPTYFLLSTSSWVTDSQFGGYGGSEYLWPGTLIYDGEVYDHIQYRPRGGVHRFQYGKNFWKFDFNRGHRFQARDEYGKKYDSEWSKLNFSSIVQQVNFGHRGNRASLKESASDCLISAAWKPARPTISSSMSSTLLDRRERPNTTRTTTASSWRWSKWTGSSSMNTICLTQIFTRLKATVDRPTTRDPTRSATGPTSLHSSAPTAAEIPPPVGGGRISISTSI